MFSAQTSFNATIWCAAKRRNIDLKIEFARAHGNACHVEGLGIPL
ncbi:DUF1090 family protein [Enterobacter wuhouensis]